MNVLSPFDETVRDLTLAQHLPRIKKLLVYACTHHWESNATGLSSYHLHDLLQQLLQIAPTFSSLKSHLNGVIQTLNKPAEYTLVANTIVRHLQHLYPDAISYSSEHYQALYRIAAQQLGQDDDVNRMKKLIHFVCRDQWTHDMESVELHELVEELHVLTPTPADLSAVLESVVQTISKPDKYRAIAQRIIQGLAPLYHPTTHALMQPEQAVSELPSINPSLQENLLPQKSVPTAIQSQKAQADTPDSKAPQASVASSPQRSARAKSKQTPDGAKKRSKPVSMRKRVASLPPDDLFGLRNEIHKFANPLLAKYLLFMNSYAAAVKQERDIKLGQWDVMVWDALKATDLDTLLCDGLKRCRNLGEFERGLKRTARQFKSPKQYSAVISAIVRAVTPKFADCQDTPAIVYPAVREESQGAPTYSKRRANGNPSQPLHDEGGGDAKAQSEMDAKQRDRLKKLAEQETSVEVMVSESCERPSTPQASAELATVGLETSGLETSGLETSGLETSGLETSGLEPTESDSHFENTETELPSQGRASESDSRFENTETDLPSQGNPDHYPDQDELKQEMSLEQTRTHELDTHHHQNAGEETAYLVAPNAAPTRSNPSDEWSSPPSSRLPAKKKQPVEETLFLPAP